MAELEQVAALVAEAESWRGTGDFEYLVAMLNEAADELTHLLAERDSLRNQRDQANEAASGYAGDAITNYKRAIIAEARAEAAEQALLAAIETFDDLRLGLELLRHPVLAMACQVAIDGSRAALAAARPEQESE